MRVPRIPTAFASALGTLTSRGTGMFRSVLLAAVLGNGLRGDIFEIANTVPNMAYILVAGGALNAVLVPQIIRAAQRSADHSKRFLDGLFTLTTIALLVATIILTAAAPLVMDVLLPSSLDQAAFADQRQSAVLLTALCMPQVFFYGVYTFLSQVLIANGRPNAAMWAPVANNVVSISVLVAFVVTFGTSAGDGLCAALPRDEALLLGLGSTAGIAVQFLILLPFIRRVGYSPRFSTHVRGLGLRRSGRLGLWTTLTVLANQIAYVVVVRVAIGGTAPAQPGACGTSSTDGLVVYNSTYQIALVPHSIITVTIAALFLARLSRLAAVGEHHEMSRFVRETLSANASLLLPIVAALAINADLVARVVFGHGAASETFDSYAGPIAVFGLALILFTGHYLSLRALFAMELNALIFRNQLAIAAVSVVGAVVVSQVDDSRASLGLAVSFLVSYGVGLVFSLRTVASRLGTSVRAVFPFGSIAVLIATGVVAAAAGYGARLGVTALLGGTESWTASLVALVVAGLVTLVVFVLLAARSMRRTYTFLTALG